MKSALQGIVWPAVADPHSALLCALLYQMEASQWWSPAALENYQFRQMEALLGHAGRTVPFYRDRLAAAGWRPGDSLSRENFSRLPILTREAVQAAGDALNSTATPAAHGAISRISTSGSTGRPVTVRSTDWAQTIWQAITLRDHFWRRRDFSGRLACIRHLPVGQAQAPDGDHYEHWGPPVGLVYETGPAFTLNIRHTVTQQLDWLLKIDPEYLLTLPSAAEALARLCMRRNNSLQNLREVRTLGEMLSPSIRATIQEAWGVPVIDSYSAQEVGYMAQQAPDADHYFVPAETIYLEVLDKQGRQCRPGETGRVVVTPLHNYATPLLRYEIGDYAEVGAPSDCGRGLPVIKRIMGRVRNMLMLPDGDARWPATGIKSFNRNNGDRIRQFQVIQNTLERLTINLVMDAPFPPDEAEALKAHVRTRLGYPFAIELAYVDDIPRSKSGKFEDFRSEVAGG